MNIDTVSSAYNDLKDVLFSARKGASALDNEARVFVNSKEFANATPEQQQNALRILTKAGAIINIVGAAEETLRF